MFEERVAEMVEMTAGELDDLVCDTELQRRALEADGANPGGGDPETSEPSSNHAAPDHASPSHASPGDLSDLSAFDVEMPRFPMTPAEEMQQRCETSTGVVVDSHTALVALIRGRVRRIVIDANGVIINQGRTNRLFTGYARSAALLLATTCTHLGCDLPAELCDVDHLDSHSEGGATDQHNASPECNSHNLFKHRAGWGARRATNGRIYHVRPDGTAVLHTGEREPEWATPPDAEAPDCLGCANVVSQDEARRAEMIAWAELLADGRGTISIHELTGLPQIQLDYQSLSTSSG